LKSVIVDRIFRIFVSMDIQAEKYHIIQQIVNLQDSRIISKMKELLSSQTTTDWYDDLTTSQKKSIQKGLQDIKEGNTFTHEEVMSSVRNKIEQLKQR